MNRVVTGRTFLSLPATVVSVIKRQSMAVMLTLIGTLPLSAQAIPLAPDTQSTLERQQIALVEQRLKRAYGDRLEVSQLESVAAGQIVEVFLTDGTVLYLSPDLQYFTYQNELFKFVEEGVVNISEQRRMPLRAKEMAQISDTDTVIFPAKGVEKARINVFTDIDCGYCQKLHQEIPQMNNLGITVRYLAYPRAGIKNRATGALTDSYRKVNYVWCQADRRTAMTTMKSSQRSLSQLSRRVQLSSSNMELTAKFDLLQQQMQSMLNASDECSVDAVASQYQLGQQIGVRGTPAIVVDDGTLIPGYVAADKLAQRLGIL